MCGIYGTISINYKNIGQKFSKDLSHRGPDDNGIFFDHSNNLALGHNRLSIIDLSNQAHQPMMDESKSYVVVFNGEIYNFKQLYKSFNIVPKTNCDCEVIIHLYNLLGIEITLNLLDGVFAFVLLDMRDINSQKIYVSRDSFGVRPLYTLNNLDYKKSITDDLTDHDSDSESDTDDDSLSTLNKYTDCDLQLDNDILLFLSTLENNSLYSDIISVLIPVDLIKKKLILSILLSSLSLLCIVKAPGESSNDLYIFKVCVKFPCSLLEYVCISLSNPFLHIIISNSNNSL